MCNVSFTYPSAALVRRSASTARTQRKVPEGRDDEERLTADIVALARQYGRYGYRKIAALLRARGLARQRQAGGADLAA